MRTRFAPVRNFRLKVDEYQHKAAQALDMPVIKPGSPPLGLRWRSHTLFILTAVGFGLFTDLFLYALIVPILPFILRDRLQLAPHEIQVHVSGLLAAYAGASVLFSAPAGVIADWSSSRQAPFLSGLVMLLVGSLLLYLGDSLPLLYLARVLQGTSAAVVWTVGLALCLDTVGPEDLGKTMGSIFSFTAIGDLVAPVVGGTLYEQAGFGAVFWLSAGLLVVDFVLRALVVEKKVARRYKSANALANGNADADEDDEPNEEDSLLRKADEENYKIPLNQPKWLCRVPILYCFRDPALLTSFLVTIVQAASFGAFDSTIPTEAQDLFHFNPLKASLLFLPLGLVNMVMGPLAGWAVDRYGTRPVAVFGFSLLAPVLLALRVVEYDGINRLVYYCALLALAGVCLACTSGPSIVEAGVVVQKYHRANPDFFGPNGPYAQLYGVSSMVFSSGLTIGPLAAGALKDSIGYGNMNAVLAGVCAVTAVVSFTYLGRAPKKAI